MNESEILKQDSYEETHWWFTTRDGFMRTMLGCAAEGDAVKILDMGCGTGHCLTALRTRGHLFGIDASPVAAALARGKGLTGISVAAVERAPFRSDSFDVILCMDILEHVENDAAILDESFRLLKPGGRLLCFVPAHRRLWSGHDVALSHKRRYALGELCEKAAASGFTIMKRTYLWAFLYPFAFVYRLTKKMLSSPSEYGRTADLFSTPAFINRIAIGIFRIEASLIGAMSLPVGTSAAILAVKPV